jgi:hypothetical protein
MLCVGNQNQLNFLLQNKLFQLNKLYKSIQIIKGILMLEIRYKLCKKNFTLPKNVNEELFFAIETRNGTRLELIAENKKDHDLYIRTLNQLLSNSDKQFNS